MRSPPKAAAPASALSPNQSPIAPPAKLAEPVPDAANVEDQAEALKASKPSAAAAKAKSKAPAAPKKQGKDPSRMNETDIAKAKALKLFNEINLKANEKVGKRQQDRMAARALIA